MQPHTEHLTERDQLSHVYDYSAKPSGCARSLTAGRSILDPFDYFEIEATSLTTSITNYRQLHMVCPNRSSVSVTGN